VAAPYGGSIAVTRNPKKLVKVQGTNKPLILLYTSSGKLTAKLQVKPRFSLIHACLSLYLFLIFLLNLLVEQWATDII